MNLKLKLLLGAIYLICFSTLMFIIFSNFDLKDLTDVNFFKNNQQLLNNFKLENIFLTIVLFSICSIIWILLLGFGAPLALFAGFLFGKWLGTLVSVISLSIGATLLYCLANFFFKDFIKNTDWSTAQGVRKFFDDKGNFWLLSIGSSPSKGKSSKASRTAKGQAQLSAQKQIAFVLFSEASSKRSAKDTLKNGNRNFFIDQIERFEKLN